MRIVIEFAEIGEARPDDSRLWVFLSKLSKFSQSHSVCRSDNNTCDDSFYTSLRYDLSFCNSSTSLCWVVDVTIIGVGIGFVEDVYGPVFAVPAWSRERFFFLSVDFGTENPATVRVASIRLRKFFFGDRYAKFGNKDFSGASGARYRVALL